MSKQSEMIGDFEKLLMKILENGSVTEEEGVEMDALEEKIYEQTAFVHGEAIASLFFQEKIEEGVNKLVEFAITPEDFFGFIEYHYDEEHPDEEKIGMFTENFTADIKRRYQENR